MIHVLDTNVLSELMRPELSDDDYVGRLTTTEMAGT